MAHTNPYTITFTNDPDVLLKPEDVSHLSESQLEKKRESYALSAYSIVGLRQMFAHRDELKKSGAPKAVINRHTL